MSKSQRSYVMRLLLGSLMTLVMLFVLLPASLYIPVVQDVVCRAVVSYLNSTNEDQEYQIGKVRIGFPLQLQVHEICVSDRLEHRQILYVGRLQTGLDDLPINQPYFILNRLSIENIAVSLDSLNETFGVIGHVCSLEAKQVLFDPSNKQFRASQIKVDLPDLSLYVGPSQTDSVEEENTPWEVFVQKVIIHEGAIRFSRSLQSLSSAKDSVPLSPYLDYNHLSVSSLNLAAENVVYDSHLIRAEIRMFQGKEQNSGLEAKQLSADFTMQDEHIELRQVDLQLSPNDYLAGDYQMDLGMINREAHSMARVNMQLAIDSLNLVRLVGPYCPALNSSWVNRQARVSVVGRISPDSLHLESLRLNIPDYIDLTLQGEGGQIWNNLHRNATLSAQGTLTHADFLLSAFVAPQSERSYRVADSLAIKVMVSQNQSAVKTHAVINQHSYEVFNAEAIYDFETEAYHLHATSNNLSVTEYYPTINIDRMAAQLQVDGRHFSFPGKNTRLDANLTIDSLCYVSPQDNCDRLMGVTASAILVDGNYAVSLNSQQPAFTLDGYVEGLFTFDSISARGFIDAPLVNLSKLPYDNSLGGLGTVGMSSQLYASYNWEDDAQINLQIDSLSYSDSSALSRFDNLVISLDSRHDKLSAKIEGGDASLKLSLDRSITDLSNVMDTLLTEFNEQRKHFLIDFGRLQQLLPYIEAEVHVAQNNPFFKTMEYQYGYSFQRADLTLTNKNNLRMDGQVLALRNPDGTVDFDTLSVFLQPCESGYQYSLHATHIDPRARKSYDIHTNGQLMTDSLTFGLSYINGNYLKIYDVSTSLAFHPDSVTLHFEKGPTFYEQSFSVNPDNYLSVMHFMNLEEQKLNMRARMKFDGPQNLQLNLYSRPYPDSKVGTQFLMQMRDLDLAYASNMMDWKDALSGRANLGIAVGLFPDSLSARLRSGIKHFQLGSYRADSLSFDGSYSMAPNSKILDGIMKVDSVVKVNLKANLSEDINVHARIDSLPLPLVNTFLPNNIQLFGFTNGSVSLRGRDLDHANVNASLAMIDAGIDYLDCDARLRFDSDTMFIDNGKLTLRDYLLYATDDRPIKVMGVVDMSKKLTNPEIKLNISGEKVNLINNHSLRQKTQYIYGRLPISPIIKVRGLLPKLDVSGSLHVLSGTDIHYYLSDDPLQASSKVDQLVDFVRFDQIDRRFQAGGSNRRPPMQDAADDEMTINLKIDIDRDVKVSAHLAGTDNNRIDIIGGGMLNLNNDRDGNLIMSGNYNMTGGKVDYKLPSLPIVKTFNITNSSFVSWDGNQVDNPAINLRAVEEVRANVSDETGTRMVRFNVGINISGTLDALQMTFDCDAPDDGAISSDIASLDADTRSKTALLLLIAQIYIGPGNTSSVGRGTANAALNSMLNRQLDSMLGNVKGTSIDVGIDTYGTDAGTSRTDYSVKVSQNFFNDRFRATIGGQFTSGDYPGQSSGAQFGDVSLEWLIKKDGSHYLKLFRHTNYESVLEGQLIETGISYNQERSGYDFRSLLLPNSTKRKRKVADYIRQLKEREERNDSVMTHE